MAIILRIPTCEKVHFFLGTDFVNISLLWKGLLLEYSLQKMICYFDNCICHQNCNCDVV